MDFKTYLQASATKIEQEAERLLSKWQEENTALSAKLTSLVETFVNANQGGKRLRGALVLLGYELAGQDFSNDILQPAAAIEIFQTAILAHDDVIDLSPTRRGKPTIYRQLGGDHYAISQAICLGDSGLFYATKLIADSNFDDHLKNKAVSIFCQMALNTVSGQMLDVEIPHLGRERKEADVLTIHKLKTAYYTIVHPLSIGIILGGGSEDLLKKAELFGENLGIAFQIQDDILGVFGDEKTMGKSVTSDVEEGKNTTLITKALEKANPDQRKVLDKYYGTGKITESQMEDVKQIFRDTGALDYSRQLAVQYVGRAKEVFSQQLLTEMADFLIDRQK